jgi:glycosyltransferase involved in cell wall biosynthesis
MKICIVTPAVICGDGQGRANYEVTWEALRRGYEVTLIASRVAPDLVDHDRLTWINPSMDSLPSALLKEIMFDWRSQDWLRKHSQEFDVIQSYGAITQFPTDINTIQFVHGGWIQSPVHTSRILKGHRAAYQWVYSALNAQWEKSALKQAKAVIGVSEKIREELIEIGVPAEKTHVILNGADLEEFRPGPADRTALQLPENVPLALFAGDIRTSRKNLDTVLKSLVQVPELHLAVVGRLAGSPYIKMVEELKLGDRVHFLDFRRDMADIMRAVDLFVFPSRYEACTLVLMEAMASGLPVITASSAGGAEVVTPDCGYVLSDSEDVLTLAQHLRDLVTDETLRQRLGSAARQIAESHSWIGKAKEYVDFFERFVAQQKSVIANPQLSSNSTRLTDVAI